jgi:hypothetical protein
MKIVTSSDKIVLYWYTPISQMWAAKKWCWETYGSGWGEVHCAEPNRIGDVFAEFSFRRMDHAQWFLIKWES